MKKSVVWIAHDTRSSCKELVTAACRGVEVLGGRAEVKGLLTTPQLHWMVRQQNRGLDSTEGNYYATLSKAFRSLVGTESSSEVLFD